jgi:hypothetical protein
VRKKDSSIDLMFCFPFILFASGPVLQHYLSLLVAADPRKTGRVDIVA